MNKLKNLSLKQRILAALAVLLSVGGGYMTFGGYSLSKCESGIATTTQSVNTGESTLTGGLLTFLVASDETASTTLRCQTGSADQIDMNLLSIGSSSASVFTYQFRFSDNGTDFYEESGKSVLSVNEVSESDGALIHKFTATSTSPFFKNITVPSVASKWFEIEIGVAGANGAVHLQAINKNEQ